MHKNIEINTYDKYTFPSISLLEENSNNKISAELLIKNAEILKRLFLSFDLDVSFEGACLGPRYTRYEIKLGKGIRVNKVLSLKDEIISRIETGDVYFEVPIPGRTTIGINIENKQKYKVSLREILESKEFKGVTSSSIFVLGKDSIGNSIMIDIDDIIHLLISGSSGTGKSSCIDTIITSILYRAHPDDVKFILINTINANLNIYNGIPHLLFPVANEYKNVYDILEWVISEIQERYSKFADYYVSDINSYNNAVQSKSKLLRKMPKIIIIIDDLTDLMIKDRKIKQYISRLTQISRLCGIHIIISTQVSGVKEIPGSIKENIPSRIAFDVFSAAESEIIIGQRGAESLLSNGDMLFLLRNYGTPIRIQGAFVSDSEIYNLVDFFKNGEYKN